MYKLIKLTFSFAFLLSGVVSAWAIAYETTDRFVSYGLFQDDYGTYLSVGIEGTEDHYYIAYNFDVMLPFGVTMPVTGATADYEYGEVYHNLEDGLYPMIYQRPNWIPDHQVDNSVKDMGQRFKVICVSLKNSEFVKTHGKMIDAYVQIHPLAKAGENQVKFRDMCLVTSAPAPGEEPPGWLPANTHHNIMWSSINIPAERTVNINISAERKWDSLILPFEFSDLPDGVEAFQASTININHEVELVPVRNLEPYKPYIIYAPEGWQATIDGVASAADFPESSVKHSRQRVPVIIDQEGYTDPYPGEAVATHGILSAKMNPHNMGSGYVLTVNDGTPAFTRVNADTPQSMGIGDVFIADDEETEHPDTLPMVRSLNVSAEMQQADQSEHPLYDLQGRKISAPQRGNIYITNGKPYMQQP